VSDGGTVSVMTDITEHKRAEQDLADKQAQLHVALDNMPGALTYTDDRLNIVFCTDRFKEMYIVPQELLQPGRPYAGLLRYLAENGYYGDGDIDALVARRIESATRLERASRITRLTGAGTASCGGGWQAAAPSP